MEAHEGNSARVVKAFTVEGAWAPVNRIKPTLIHPRPIIEDDFSRLSQQNQAQILLSGSISSSEIRSNSPNANNTIWETHHNSSFIERENAKLQRRGLEDYLSHWSSHGRRSLLPFVSPAQSSSPSLGNSWEMPRSNNGLSEYASVLDTGSDESLAQFNNMSFGDLLAMKGSSLEPSTFSTKLGGSDGATTSALFPRSDSQPNGRGLDRGFVFGNQDTISRLNFQTDGICGGETLTGDFHNQDGSLSNLKSPPRTKHANGRISTFAPLTPDLRWRAESTIASGTVNPGVDDQQTDDQNVLREHELAAVMVNLQEANNNQVMGAAADTSPGKVSILAEENHNPDKGGEQGIDLNKAPLKKPRRKRYLPKVVREDKPKRTPKPSTPKPMDSKESQNVKKKYVRKNKMNPPSTASPTAETTNAKRAEQAVKTCRKSLNFDSNEQEAEHISLHMSNGDLCRKPHSKDNHTTENQSSNVIHLGQGEELTFETSHVVECDLNHTLGEELKNYTSQSAVDKLESLSEPNSSSCASSNEGVQTRGSKRGNSSVTDAAAGNPENVTANHCNFWQSSTTLLGTANFHGVTGILFPEICKKKRTDKGQRSHTPSTPSTAAPKDVSAASNIISHSRVDAGASKYYYCNPPSFGGNAVAINRAAVLMQNVQSRVQLFNSWADISRLKKKKRSKATTRVRDLSELKGIASVLPATPAAKSPGRRKVEISDKPYPCKGGYMNLLNSVHSCIEALTDDIQTTPKSKRGPRKKASLRSSNIDEANKCWDLILYDGHHCVKKKKGTRASEKMHAESKGSCPVTFSTGCVRWISTFSLEAITEGLKLLDINREVSEISCREQSALVPYQKHNRQQNALVLYKKEGREIVSFEGPFEPIRKRRQRAKVELDDETTRVWRLLLENIDNQGIDGTDEEKVKWWENERNVFHGRVDSFIARMRLVQGDRRFTPWKGSVLDSVIGVFLTQNVSDHLSSSAFMALAAHFPLKSNYNESTLSEEAMSALVVEPEVCIIEPEESITWNENALDPLVCTGNSGVIHESDNCEEKEVVNSKELIGSAAVSVIPTDYYCENSLKATSESKVDKENGPTKEPEGASIIGDDRARDDATSSQQYVISSQKSVNTPNFPALGMRSFPETNQRAQALLSSSKCYYFDCSTSFMGLLKMAESPLLHESQSQILGQDQPGCMRHVGKDHLGAPSTSSSNYQPNQQIDFHLQAFKYIEMLGTESRSCDASRRDEKSPTEQSNLTESVAQHLGKEKALDGGPRSFAGNVSSFYVLEGEKMVIQSQMRSMEVLSDKIASSAQGQTNSIWKGPNLPNISQEPDATESTADFDRASNYREEIDQVSKHSNSSRIVDATNPSPIKPRSRSGKEKRNAYDWDSLRKQAQPNGIKRERTADIRDSIDWEAVRLADVSEIADTIKARGMNNMLAERIKELLDRLVRDHGSVDLEWLRDIPPDKAKEYLLSFRGLGLKSVECVRLLTLHHLAFPVDTNVGRIAVRLGWVPLQPLPESLQLHLLELYPVLESIQKYLWPRLCKLDQKTLYELHYHLITFGKVFCTKRRPNCNACPLRGECRHFASAFASARLALPGPEERSIMASSGGISTHPHPQANIDPLALPLLWDNHHQANSRCNTDASLIDVPSAPFSLPLPQTVSQLEKKLEISNCEPIVEVPASPELELEQEQTLCDIEDTLYEDPDEIPTIKLNMKEFTQTLENFMQANRDLQETGMSNALVALTPEAASIPTPKLKNISRLRTEHHVYELPDSHPLLKELDRREPDDPCSYLLAIWTPGETANSFEPPARKCSFEDPSILCNEVTCCYCSSQREANSQIVRGTLLIPCRTAMRGSFPLNGTYFQVNEVFADHDSSLNPIDVPRSYLWNLPRRTVYFGTSIPTIFRGLNTEEIQHCFWRGYVCVRGFDQKTRAPRPLMARLHFPASKMPRGAKGKGYADDEYIVN